MGHDRLCSSVMKLYHAGVNVNVRKLDTYHNRTEHVGTISGANDYPSETAGVEHALNAVAYAIKHALEYMDTFVEQSPATNDWGNVGEL